MPELPEVETIKNILKPIVIGNTITKIDILKGNIVSQDHSYFITTLTGQTFKDITRKGKYLFFHLSNDLVLISHLRMEGKYYDYLENDKNSYYAKVVFHLNNGHKLVYDDSRAFGIMILSTEKDYLNEKEIAKLGPEPFEANPKKLFELNKNNKAAIKTTIVDQSVMAGIGNIYADETLYASKIHPHTSTNSLTLKDWENIVKNARDILTTAINLGGSTIRSYHPGKNIDGKFQNEIKIYGNAGKTCTICGKTFIFCKTNGRGTTYCPGCQHKHGNKIVVGLTGAIATGKSHVVKLFTKENLAAISCDDIVAQLYKNKTVINSINNVLHLSFENEIDKSILKAHIESYPNDLSRIERLIFPLVRTCLEEFIKNSKSPIILVEAPLLFKAHYEDMFDTMIVLFSNDKNQNIRLEQRNGEKGIFLKQLNQNNWIEQNKNKAEFLVHNNGSIEEFDAQINQIINTLKQRLN